MTPPLANAITHNASRQTFYTIRYLADRERTGDAYRAYAYFRWLDDALDAEDGSRAARQALLARQQALLAGCYQGKIGADLLPEERLLVELVNNDPQHDRRLRAYLDNMMAVMSFDAGRRGRIITQAELDQYTHGLACAVTEAMHTFIGHTCPSPQDDTRYLAVSAAHITHMLRDTADDLRNGYYNIPAEVLDAGRISPYDLESPPYRAWVRNRVALARKYFKTGRNYLLRVPNLRCRLAGFAYMRRFEHLLDIIEVEEYLLRPVYAEPSSWKSGWSTTWNVLLATLGMTPVSQEVRQ